MKKFLTLILGIMLIMTCLLPCAALAEAELPEAIEPAPTQPIDPTDVSWLTAYLDFVIVGICVVVGLLIKHCTPLNNKYIPLIVALAGLLIAVWTHWGDGVTPIVLLGGLFSGLASTGFHQAFKQLFFTDGK